MWEELTKESAIGLAGAKIGKIVRLREGKVNGDGQEIPINQRISMITPLMGGCPFLQSMIQV
jgi:hypothetical protein